MGSKAVGSKLSRAKPDLAARSGRAWTARAAPMRAAIAMMAITPADSDTAATVAETGGSIRATTQISLGPFLPTVLSFRLIRS